MKALIFYGGWDGHTPVQTSELFAKELKARGFDVEMATSLDCLNDGARLKTLDLIVPQWTMGQMTGEQFGNLSQAVQSGVGFGGAHGGTGDAFRGVVEYGWLTGGQFVGHPYVGEYEVRLTTEVSEITAALPQSFRYNSEQYYMITDPGNRVLADTLYSYEGKRVVMPVIWTKSWGKGRVFYSALGHAAQEFVNNPHVLDMTIRGLLWAAAGKK